MKLENVKIGQILNDKFGNKYEVTQIDEDDDLMPIELKCIEFVKDVCIGCDKITKVGYHSWFLKDRSRILSSDSIVGEFLKNVFSNTELFNDKLELIDLSLNDVKCRFLFGNAKSVKKVDVTLKDLCIYDNTNYPTKDNIRLGDIILDKDGNEYKVIAKYYSGIDVKHKTKITGINNTVLDVNSIMYIPFADSTHNENSFNSKIFRKK